MQVQLTMFCCGLKQCMLLIWVSTNDYRTVNIPFDETYVKNVIDRLKLFYAKKMLPVLSDEVEEDRLALSYKFRNFMGLP